jgi:hypothetical protein
MGMCTDFRDIRSLQVCQQIAYIFLPVGSAITTMQMHLMRHLESTGAVRLRRAASSDCTLPVSHSAPLLRQRTNSLQHSTPTGSCNSSLQMHVLSGCPRDFLTPLLPQVMFDYIACLLNIGMRMDEIARQHNIQDLKALDILKQQVCMPRIHAMCYLAAHHMHTGNSRVMEPMATEFLIRFVAHHVRVLAPAQVAYVLGELTDLSSATVSAVMSLCRGRAPHVPGQLDCLSSFLVASLDQMTASVSLMHGRLPLNESDEALQKIAQCASPPPCCRCDARTKTPPFIASYIVILPAASRLFHRVLCSSRPVQASSTADCTCYARAIVVLQGGAHLAESTLRQHSILPLLVGVWARAPDPGACHS